MANNLKQVKWKQYLLFNFYSDVDIFIFAFANRVASSVLIPILIAQYSLFMFIFSVNGREVGMEESAELTNQEYRIKFI